MVTASGWFAARPSGTENVYKVYAESFCDEVHLRRILEEAQAVVSATLTAAAAPKDREKPPALAAEADREAVEAWENEGDPN